MPNKSNWTVALLAALVWLVCCGEAPAAKVEAVKNKKYALSEKHGPWMIMVASLWGESPEQTKRAAQAAHELVYELRRKGIPAYVYSQDAVVDRVRTMDRMGRPQERVNRSAVRMIKSGQIDKHYGVVAGNYTSVEDKIAQKTLKFIKAYEPKCFPPEVRQETPGRRGPLGRAFLTINPLVSPEEVARSQPDPLLARLNSGIDHSLLHNPGEYTLIVASFYGKSHIQPAEFENFDSDLKAHSRLDRAAYGAWELVQAMRSQGLEAYLYHEQFRSIVTVGAFASPEDPGIRHWGSRFAAKEKPHPENGSPILVSESIQIPGNNNQPVRNWVMDPVPELIKVPRLKRQRAAEKEGE